MTLRVLIACECSGRVRDQFAKRGWEAWSADILPSETGAYASRDHPHGKPLVEDAGYHYQGDCRDLFYWDHPVNHERLWECMAKGMKYALQEAVLWDLIIAHPPCTDLSYAGARWFREKQADGRQQAAIDFFMEMVNSPSPLVAVENPHSIVQKPEHAGPPTQIVQPYYFGDAFQKEIHLWLKGLPKLVPDNWVEPTERAATGGGSWRTDRAANKVAMSRYEDSEGRANRAKVRSRTFQGFARAMADQWGKFAEEYYLGEDQHRTTG